MTPAAVRKIALALEGAQEAPHFDRTSFRVRGRIFATMTADGAEAMVRVPVETVSTWLDSGPEVFFSYGKWTTNSGMLGVRLAKTPAALLKELVRESWRRIAERPERPAKATAKAKASAKRAKPRRPTPPRESPSRASGSESSRVRSRTRA